MLVTPTRKKFGKYSPGQPFMLPDKTAAALIHAGLLVASDENGKPVEISGRTGRPKRTYQRRDLRAEH